LLALRQRLRFQLTGDSVSRAGAKLSLVENRRLLLPHIQVRRHRHRSPRPVNQVAVVRHVRLPSVSAFRFHFFFQSFPVDFGRSRGGFVGALGRTLSLWFRQAASLPCG
jgi:hypothetical protein